MASVDMPGMRAFGLGLMLPGAGFLEWWPAYGVSTLLISALAFAVFAATIVLWFGTGNLIAPLFTWVVLALVPALATPAMRSGHHVRHTGHGPHWTVLTAVAVTLVMGAIMMLVMRERMRRRRPADSETFATVITRDDVVDEHSMGVARLLLDRALQPVDEFKGFERRDQFQTAATRYQITFSAHALAMMQSRWTPAFRGYALEAQRRLLAKQSDPRVWRYWRLENAWGNLSLNPDPVPCGNIMYTGFVAAQIALAEAATGVRLTPSPHLELELPGKGLRRYDLADMVDLLVEQYERAPWGLLGCEPHWIYPLCNTISAVALRADSARRGRDTWSRVSPGFRAGLEREFTTRDGRILPFRSSITGLPSPRVGGAVIQALPCLYMNGTLPDVAKRQWDLLRDDLARKNWRRAFWPIDVGNYGFSRASSLTASAAAAMEMGDQDMAQRMLDMLDEECPVVMNSGVVHRRNASLWAMAMELTARSGGQDRLANLSVTPVRSHGAYIELASYPDVLVTRAVAREGGLDIGLQVEAPTEITLAGLAPNARYVVQGTDDGLTADADGRATMGVARVGRTLYKIRRAS